MLQKAAKPTRKPTNVSLDSRLVEEAKALGINMSQAAEAGLAKAISEEKSRQWLEENREAIESSNEYVERNGLPLAKYRMF
ncbi:type II toxin-antitoxin system CcdA family antitoxin [Aminobacter sp. P9b]|uniref:Antitoxin CcdA n=1 Tax=Aminobacter niigataensis TaxID=83265 RepID=A0ABR6L1N2_9HYPH|nr:MULTISPECIES: type II toxin-antitoxin system CcdA family antitoxin [Aminobacter]AWC21886.1 Post-segregation antitoxin (ccd killing mechanism protein) encoded by the F plasmid [Aminobacter sp. MSH1]MBB4650707.1 antitoxin CcdA [Aminobacter niigataensis]